ncbi:uncharacterized protein LOC142976127 [Anticarsia gemmatalis]|uniref:uncharacterized protein LOC142976127 n=1 Tax=Anticarsia gemmatalis TaxID=129554 RepID=UPI003F758215
MSNYHANCTKSSCEEVTKGGKSKKLLTCMVKPEEKEKEKPSGSAKTPSILDVLNPDRDCNCEVVARVLRSHVHKNIGMTTRRDEIDGVDTSCESKGRKPDHR